MAFNSFNKFLQITLILFVFISCTDSETEKANNEMLEVSAFTPNKIKEFDRIDTLYYSYLGVSSFPTEEGGFVLSVWDPAKLVKTNADLNSITAATKKGRGPGEFLDIGRPTMNNERLYVYDQFQTKIVILNRSNLSLVEEMITEPYKTYRVSRVYPEFSNGKLPMVLSQSQLIIDKMAQQLLMILDPETGDYEKSIPIKGIAYAPIGELRNGRSGSAMQVPYSDNQLIAAVPERSTLLLYDTRTDVIAEVDVNFDTLRSITVSLPSEAITEDEVSRIKEERELDDEDWKDVESYIPEVKAPATDMIYSDGRIWLKSTIETEIDLWFVLNVDGEIEYKVELPNNSFLTHVSEFHLGVRLDEINFALYENPISEAQN